jgi:hypothetical protein
MLAAQRIGLGIAGFELLLDRQGDADVIGVINSTMSAPIAGSTILPGTV